MRDLVRMWSNTRMIVLVAVIAAVYAAILIPFKGIPLIPGITELRPANAIPPVASFLFGPAAAWGVAFGNLIGDFFGTLGPGTLFGFVGNLLLGWIPYRMWRAMSTTPWPSFVTGGAGGGGSSLGRDFVAYAFVMLVASAACALVIAWGLLALFQLPFRPTSLIILANNFAWSVIASPLILRAVGPRVRAWGLTADQILGEEDLAPPSPLRKVGLVLVPVAALGGLAVGLVLTGVAPAEAILDPRWVLGIPAVAVVAGTALL